MNLSFLISAIKPFLNKMGEGLYKLDADLGSKDLCVLITKSKDQQGKTHTFMSYIERPTNLRELYIKDKDGKNCIMGIEGLSKLFDQAEDDA
jgi:hypothetical protein